VRDLFACPAALPILGLVPIVWLALFAVDRARARRLARVVGPRAAALTPELSLGHRRMRRSLATAAVLLALLAILQPLWGLGARSVEQRGVDILVCLDVSRSMLARDLPPSRLLNARREIRSLAETARGDRLGLIAFAGEARLVAPLTQDLGSFEELVEQADALSVKRGGTNLGAALATARETLQDTSGEHEVVLLLTDGEDLEQHGLREAEKLREQNITVHCVGFGSALGSKIAVEAESGETFLRDRSGEEVVSAMDPASLRQIAAATGGTFVDASATPRPLVDLYQKRILPMARKALAAEERRERTNRFQWPLFAAVLLWMLELGLSDRKRR